MGEIKRAVGRPSKYNPAMQAQAEAYIHGWKEYGDVVPSLAGLACWCGISRDTCKEWVKNFPEFSATAKVVLIMQERMLINGGLSKVNDASITKLLLASNHGYSDKVQNDLVSSDGTMSPKPLIDPTKLSTKALEEILNAAKPDA